MFVKDNVEVIELDLTGTCNARCPLCARNYKHLNVVPNERHLNEITAQLDEFKNLKNVYLVGTVSEPTLYKQFFNLCHYLIKRDIAIEICTNGDTHNPKWWAELGSILTAKDSVYFSVCGSTEELHQTYRMGASLLNLLKNARALRSTNPHGVDWIQHIEFEYNKHDLKSARMQEIMAEFGHINLTLTYFTRDKNIYKNTDNLDKLLISSEYLDKYDVIVDYSKKKWENRAQKAVSMECQSILEKEIHINQFGKIFPCYVWLEESRQTEWNGSYDDILEFKYECCKFCEKNTKQLLRTWKCELL